MQHTRSNNFVTNVKKTATSNKATIHGITPVPKGDLTPGQGGSEGGSSASHSAKYLSPRTHHPAKGFVPVVGPCMQHRRRLKSSPAVGSH